MHNALSQVNTTFQKRLYRYVVCFRSMTQISNKLSSTLSYILKKKNLNLWSKRFCIQKLNRLSWKEITDFNFIGDSERVTGYFHMIFWQWVDPYDTTRRKSKTKYNVFIFCWLSFVNIFFIYTSGIKIQLNVGIGNLLMTAVFFAHMLLHIPLCR